MNTMPSPVPLGASLPPRDGSPHAWMAPLSLSAANASSVEEMLMKPVPFGAPLPPNNGLPHEWMERLSSSAAKAL
jgi:DMSO/TMAO reductase YedYZ molybdopterin-dependent catalytic subunit